jgi:hypothetical protein
MPSYKNKIFIVFTCKNASFGAHHQTFTTFANAWKNAKSLYDSHITNGGTSMRILHDSADECLAANPSGKIGNTLYRQWVWGDHENGDSDTQRIMGKAVIIELNL